MSNPLLEEPECPVCQGQKPPRPISNTQGFARLGNPREQQRRGGSQAALASFESPDVRMFALSRQAWGTA